MAKTRFRPSYPGAASAPPRSPVAPARACSGESSPPDDAPRAQPCRAVRVALMMFGWLNVALGVAGLFLPLVPTTVFLLMALWAFSRSSLRFHAWLYNHPRLGRPLRDWHRDRIIPLGAKRAAAIALAISLLTVIAAVRPWPVAVAAGGVLACVALFILSRPHNAPASALTGSRR